MAQYKVPQDVEADDKLLGPFTFRQFIYLMITVGCIGLAFGLYNLFPLLAIVPVPFVIFFSILALPLKKDQPMETYLAAIVSYHVKPRTRVWNPGQRESTIVITAPKQVEAPRTRNISGEEASTRLSFLAGVVDSEGYSIHGDANGPMRDDFLAENFDAHDMLDGYSSPVINAIIAREQQQRRTAAISQMRQPAPAAPSAETTIASRPATAPAPTATPARPATVNTPSFNNYQAPSVAPQNVQAMTDAQAFATPTLPVNYQAAPKPTASQTAELTALSKNTTATVDYLARKANEITNNEVYVSLH